MAILRPALLLGLLLGATPALAQSPAPGAGPGPAAPAGPIVGGRRVTPMSQTKPTGNAAATGLPQPVSQAEMIKAQKAAEARSKAWDSKMRHTMGSICHGC
ncbi:MULTISPECIES: hypothetical protein [Methylobacterium]|uniref:hypothetical protein n=1 Tax=Methylobacterium TaxID=407 RepID=UPI00035C3D43|nr:MULTISPECIES: hypothetical protein [Methylobacterium]KQS84928.1 hypothetical protein ASG32_19635 [Methylobacterium sp. Leaf361]MBN4095245.1 hypothetical protein [Methylobacterium sp. OT2]UIN32381.1 hypothetical protein LXM90_14725 [Methylobacterium oryzae]SEH32365.1 hypothetical protein SAMN02799636_01236 [Methylobacterium sp. 275MFSha3.1]SEO26929.1 hypothetical protein SAMN02799625_02850 [Methylobacterium sp. UNC300MFChir4.1]